MTVKIADIKFQTSGGKKKDFDWISVLLILLAIGIIVGSLYLIFYLRESKVLQQIQSGKEISAIVVENNGPQTESIFLSFYNPRTHKEAVIVIPSQTRVKAEYKKKPAYDTIKNIYSKGGSIVIRRTIEKLTRMKFTYILVYDLSVVEQFVDMLEGLTVYVPHNINYLDEKKGLYIRIPKGKNLLDGAKVKELLLYHYGEDGLKGMIENHRRVAVSLLDRSNDVKEVFSHTSILRTFMKKLDTNFSQKDIKTLSVELSKLNSSRILFYKMFGKYTVIKDETYLTPIENGKWLQERISEVSKFINNKGPAPIGDEINIEILNGSNNPGQAQNLRNYFITYGFNVVHYGNALRNDYKKTVVIDRVGRPMLAKRVADIINCKEVYTKVDKSLLVDITIIIGNDFEGNYVR